MSGAEHKVLNGCSDLLVASSLRGGLPVILKAVIEVAP